MHGPTGVVAPPRPCFEKVIAGYPRGNPGVITSVVANTDQVLVMPCPVHGNGTEGDVKQIRSNETKQPLLPEVTGVVCMDPGNDLLSRQ